MLQKRHARYQREEGPENGLVDDTTTVDDVVTNLFDRTSYPECRRDETESPKAMLGRTPRYPPLEEQVDQDWTPSHESIKTIMCR